MEVNILAFIAIAVFILVLTLFYLSFMRKQLVKMINSFEFSNEFE